MGVECSLSLQDQPAMWAVSGRDGESGNAQAKIIDESQMLNIELHRDLDLHSCVFVLNFCYAPVCPLWNGNM